MTISNKLKREMKESVYIDEIREEDIPEYDYINEKIINAEDWIWYNLFNL